MCNASVSFPGNGKTLAFLLPIMEKILRVKKNLEPVELSLNKPIAVIVVPMRELADQIFVSSHPLP